MIISVLIKHNNCVNNNCYIKYILYVCYTIKHNEHKYIKNNIIKLEHV